MQLKDVRHIDIWSTRWVTNHIVFQSSFAIRGVATTMHTSYSLEKKRVKKYIWTVWLSLTNKYGHSHSTYLPLDNMAPFLQTTFQNTFYWITMIEFLFAFHWNLFPGVQLTTLAQHGTCNSLGPKMQQTITWTNADPVHWRIYVALGGDALNGTRQKGIPYNTI